MKVQIITPGPYQHVKTDKGGQAKVGAQFLVAGEIAEFSDSYAEWCIRNGYVKEPEIQLEVKKSPPAVAKMEIPDITDYPVRKKPAVKRPAGRRVPKKSNDDD